MEFSSKISQKSPQVVKHVVKGEKWACSTLKAGKNKPVMFIAKTRDFKRYCEKTKENRRFDRTSDFDTNILNSVFLKNSAFGGSKHIPIRDLPNKIKD